MPGKYITCIVFVALLHFIAGTIIIQPFNRRANTAYDIAFDVSNNFFQMFLQCLETPMLNQQFLTDDLHNYVNNPMKTTVGISPRYTSNRKFFANLMNTPAFKKMLTMDINEMRVESYKKMKYCDEATMDQTLLRDFYNHELDQTKM